MATNGDAGVLETSNDNNNLVTISEGDGNPTPSSAGDGNLTTDAGDSSGDQTSNGDGGNLTTNVVDGNGDQTSSGDGGDGNQATNGDDSVANGTDDAIQQAPEGHEGYMYKESDDKQTWEKKYFILRANKIDFFKTKGDVKPEGTINLVDGIGVREKEQCKCTWPSDTAEDYCFGLATKSQTWYFKTTPDEGTVGDWKRLIQETIVKVGKPDPNTENDPEGKKRSFMVRKIISIGAFFTKIAMKFAPVDDRVRDSVTAGADLVEDQADADPNASLGERAAMGVKGGVGIVGGAVGGDVASATVKVVGFGADIAEEVCKEERKEEEKEKKRKSGEDQ